MLLHIADVHRQIIRSYYKCQWVIYGSHTSPPLPPLNTTNLYNPHFSYRLRSVMRYQDADIAGKMLPT